MEEKIEMSFTKQEIAQMLGWYLACDTVEDKDHPYLKDIGLSDSIANKLESALK